MADLATIHGGQLPIKQADPALVDICDRLLKAAQSGELRGLAYVSVHGDRFQVGHGWSGAAGTRWPLAGGIAGLFNRYTEENHRDAEPTGLGAA